MCPCVSKLDMILKRNCRNWKGSLASQCRKDELKNVVPKEVNLKGMLVALTGMAHEMPVAAAL